jgi:hypothetical protein
MDICSYKNIFGRPREGVHSIRFMDVAVVDVFFYHSPHNNHKLLY